MLRQVKRALPRTVASGLRLFTNESYDRIDAVNAEQFHSCYKNLDPDADGALIDVVRTITGTLSISDLVKISELGERAYPAIIRALNFGQLRQVSPGYYGPKTIVARGDLS
jgi:hypothetical protein